MTEPNPHGMGLDRFSIPTASLLLEVLVEQLALTKGGAVARSAIYPGEEIAPMDECCLGQAAVRVYRVFPMTGKFPQQHYGVKHCSERLSYGVTCEMTVYRCASQMSDNGEPPSPGNLTDDAKVQLDDAAAMRRAIVLTASALQDMPWSGYGGFMEDDYNPVGPAGDCIGGRQRVIFQAYEVPVGTPPMQL
jgi:hypothetical protein